jgi:hypothetical protein
MSLAASQLDALLERRGALAILGRTELPSRSAVGDLQVMLARDGLAAVNPGAGNMCGILIGST